jgi:hypothetical protein
VAPVVKVFFSTKSQMPIPAERLDLSQRGCTDRIVGRETRVPGRFERLDELWVDPDTLRRSALDPPADLPADGICLHWRPIATWEPR